MSADAALRADVVVVGLGLVGAGALRHLADAGVQVVGVGPAEPAEWSTHPGVFASHYDSGRITRKLDARWEWAELAVRSLAAYPGIEESWGQTFHWPTGTVFASSDPGYLEDLTAVGLRVGAEFDLLSPQSAGDVADGRLAFPPGATVVREAAPAGFIDPRRMLAAQLAVAADRGATVLRAEVTDVSPDGTGGWLVRASDGRSVGAERVLVATGAHTDEVGGLPLPRVFGVRPETVVLATLDDDEQARLQGIPSVLAHLPGSSFADLYQVPPTDYPDGTVRLKLGATLRRYDTLDDGEARRAWMAGDTHRTWLDELRSLTEDLVPDVRATAWETKPCMITETLSGLPVVDHVADGVVLAAGGNGYAAKSADAIGALAATLVREGRWTDPALSADAFSTP